MTLDIKSVRAQFPALHHTLDGHPPIFLDNPAGTQVPQAVMDAVVDYYTTKNANDGGNFAHSRATNALMQEAREVLAAFVNAPRPEEIVFGANMTTLNFAFSRALGQTLPDDAEIVLTRMDHDANVAPWVAVARDRNLPVKWVDFRPEDGTLDMSSLEAALSEKTAVVAAVHASNALGTINPVHHMAEMAHAVGALFVVDAVQSAPHVRLDVQALGCDVLICSAYKFFGPHVGVLWAKYDLLERLPAYKVRPSKDAPPYRWETGTPSFETIAGTAAAVRYMASLAGGTEGTLKTSIDEAYAQIQAYELQLSERLLSGLLALPGVRVAGITNKAHLPQRVATFSFSVDGHSPAAVTQALGQQHIQARHGDYYAVEVMQRLGKPDEGMVRVGAVHYNTADEIDRFLNALEGLL